jgi:hypothetical protein
MTPYTSADGNARLHRVFIPVLTLFAFASVFVALRSNDFFTVDGAFRCFDVYRLHRFMFDINNHLLYLFDVSAWTQFTRWLGFRYETPLQFFSDVEIMNCLAGAGCLAIFCFLLFLATSSWPHALVGTLGYGFCRAFIAQATNANQPMLGIFWSFAALYFAVLSLKRISCWLACVSGFLFALAMATYQSTILLAFIVVVLMFTGRSGNLGRFVFNRHRFLKFCAFVFSGIITSVVIFAGAYHYMGVGGPGAMVRRFFWHQEARVYLRMSIGKVANIPIGMLRNTFPILPSYNGLHGLMARKDLASLASLILVAVFSGFLLFCGVRLWQGRARLNHSEKIGILSAAVGFTFTMLPVVLYDPMYDKLWIQPLACLAVFLVISLRVISRGSKLSFLISRTVSVLIIAGLASNLGWVMRAHVSKPYQLAEAQRLSGMLEKGDLLVGDWDEISDIYSSLLADEDHYFSFPTEAVISGVEAVSRLSDVISKTRERGGHVYFLSILDQQEDTWNSYLGTRCGVPYDALRIYREKSKVRGVFQTKSGDTVLREFWPGEN